MEVLTWQVCIVFGIAFSTLLFDRRGLFLSTLAAVAWTIAMIFTAWLFILQLITIGVAFTFGLGILQGPRFKEHMAKTRKLTLASIAFTVIGSVVFNINHYSPPPVSTSGSLIPGRMIAGASRLPDEPTAFSAAVASTSNSVQQHERRNERPSRARSQPLRDATTSQQVLASDAPAGDPSYDAIYARELKKTRARLLEEQTEFEARLELARQRRAQGSD